MSKLKMAVAGAGLIGRRHVALIEASSACELAAIADPGPGAAEFARAHGVPHFTALTDLLARAKPDGVIDATPNHLHVSDGLACIAAGVPVLIEKPVAHTVEDGVRLRDAAEHANARVLVGHHRLHSPIVELACGIIASGELGPIVAVMGSAMFYKPDDYFDQGPWRREPGGGPILINMIHEIGNLRAMIGEIVAVQAFASNATRRHAVEDTVAINLRFANGALGTFLLSDTAASARSWEQTVREDPSFATYDDEDCYVIAGASGSLAVPTMRLKTYARTADRSWWKPMAIRVAAIDRVDPLERQLAHFCAVIRGEAAPLVTVRDGLQNLRVTEAIAKAAATGQIVSVDA
jgi:predicted dehydrogenase